MVYARLLSFDEARNELGPFLGHPEGEERAKAQRILIATVLHDRGATADAGEDIKGTGATVVRAVGTEPLIAGMDEGDDEKLVHAVVKDIVGAVKKAAA